MDPKFLLLFALHGQTEVNDLFHFLQFSFPGHSGWHTYDVTSTLSDIFIERSSDSNHQIAVGFIHTADGMTKSNRPLRRQVMLRRFNSLALVLFTNDTKNVTLDHLNPLSSVGEDMRSPEIMIDPETGMPVTSQISRKR